MLLSLYFPDGKFEQREFATTQDLEVFCATEGKGVLASFDEQQTYTFNGNAWVHITDEMRETNRKQMEKQMNWVPEKAPVLPFTLYFFNGKSSLVYSESEETIYRIHLTTEDSYAAVRQEQTPSLTWNPETETWQ